MPLKHEVEEIKLNNGAAGLLIYVPDATTVHYDIHFRAGIDFVKDQTKSQAAHVMEHLAFGQNAKFASLEAFSREFSKNGAYSNAWTGGVDMVYYIDAALMEWERIFDLQTLAITQPRFTQKSLDAEKGNVREELTGYANDHRRVLWQQIMRRAQLKRWYDPGELKTVDAVTLATIKDHYQRTHTTKNMHFVIAGNLKDQRDKIVEKLEQWPLSEGERLPVIKDTARSTGLVHIRRKDLPNLTFHLAFFIDRILTPEDWQAMNVLNHILTGTFHSRIWGVARSRGICYGMNSWNEASVTGASSWWFGGQVSLENAKELFELIIKELDSISKDGITAVELERAKEYRLGSLQMSVETVRSLANWYNDSYFDYERIDYIDDFPGLISATTLEDVKKLANEFLQSGVWSFGGVGNISKEALKIHYDAFADSIEKR